MTTTLVFEAPGAVIRAADAPRRTITGRVLTYGEYGNTSAGRKRFAAGSLELPTDTPARVLLLRGHTDPATGGITASGDGEQAGAAVRLTDTPEALDAEFRVTALPVGDVLLAEADPACPIRGGLSVEVTDVQYDPADPDTVIRARLKAVAAVPFQAYPSSRMTSVAASAHDIPTGAPNVTAPTAPADTTPAAAPAAAPAIDLHALAALLAPQLSAAMAPGGLPTGTVTGSPGLAPSAPARADAEDPIATAATLQAEVFRTGGGTSELRAALADITNTGLDLFQNPGLLGEKLWEGSAGTARPFVEMMDTSLALTQWKGTGWQWVNRPQVAAYAGDKAPIPTNTVSVDTIEWEADRVAGGWDIDRKFRDFGDAEFWSEFYTAQVESYREVTNQQAATAIISYARDITLDANVPTGFTGINVAQADVLRAAALGQAILKATPRVKQSADYVIMNTADWLGLLDVTNLDLPAFLAMLGVNPAGFDHHPEVPAGSVILGVKKASRFRELGGGSPIRVEALDVARAGIDSAVYGYTARYQTRPGGIIRVPLAA